MGIIAGYIVFFTITYMLSAEYLSLSPSKGEVLLFLRPGTLLGALGRRSGHDEESGPAGGLPRASQPSDHKEPTHHVPAEGKPHGRIFHWSNVCYDISIAGERRRILDNVDGWVRPGTLTALMVSIQTPIPAPRRAPRADSGAPREPPEQERPRC